MLDEKVLSILNDIAVSIKEAGLDPHDQLYGYVTTDNELYITRHREAREQIKKLCREDIFIYLSLQQRSGDGVVDTKK